MKKMLLKASDDFEQTLVATGIGMPPTTVTFRGNVDLADIIYPYLLWDPITQF